MGTKEEAHKGEAGGTCIVLRETASSKPDEDVPMYSQNEIKESIMLPRLSGCMRLSV